MKPTDQIDKMISDLNDWRGKKLEHLRSVINSIDPSITEDWKWGTPVFTAGKMICALGAFKDHIKINFFKGASLKDPHKLFNSGLEAKTSRSIDLYESDSINESAFKDLIREAVAVNAKK